MIKVPRTATQKNVNSVVFQMLKAHTVSGHKILDIPCGEGEFADFIAHNIVDVDLHGVDSTYFPSGDKKLNFYCSDITKFLRAQKRDSFNSVICISGVMCFDSIAETIQHFNRVLKQSGLVVITNDNILTVRDRIEFLLFGRLKRFKLVFRKDENIWNLVLLQTIHMLLRKNNFKEIRVKFTSMYWEDLIFVPFALLLYPLLLVKLYFIKIDLSYVERVRLLPFGSLLGRHYILSAFKSDLNKCSFLFPLFSMLTVSI